MGTNYFLHSDVCEKCGRSDEAMHIGKSSAGWCFSLHVHPEEGIDDLPAWIDRWSQPSSIIKDEYGEAVTPEEMLRIITERKWHSQIKKDASYYEENFAEPGPFGLMRHQVDGQHCSKHGKGTWDCMRGEFS